VFGQPGNLHLKQVIKPRAPLAAITSLFQTPEAEALPDVKITKLADDMAGALRQPATAFAPISYDVQPGTTLPNGTQTAPTPVVVGFGPELVDQSSGPSSANLSCLLGSRGRVPGLDRQGHQHGRRGYLKRQFDAANALQVRQVEVAPGKFVRQWHKMTLEELQADFARRFAELDRQGQDLDVAPGSLENQQLAAELIGRNAALENQARAVQQLYRLASWTSSPSLCR